MLAVILAFLSMLILGEEEYFGDLLAVTALLVLVGIGMLLCILSPICLILTCGFMKYGLKAARRAPQFSKR